MRKSSRIRAGRSRHGRAFRTQLPGASSRRPGVSGSSRGAAGTMTAAGQARGAESKARAEPWAERASRGGAGAGGMHAGICSRRQHVQHLVVDAEQCRRGRAPAIVGEEQRAACPATSRRRPGLPLAGSPDAGSPGHESPADGAVPTRRRDFPLDTSSPNWAAAWPELEALAQELAITQHGGEPEAAALQEQLSHRETEVLRYLPSLLTASEIGAELYVSVNTVKAHLRSIYRKLGVSRRRDAVARARQYGILRGPSSPDEYPVE